LKHLLIVSLGSLLPQLFNIHGLRPLINHVITAVGVVLQLANGGHLSHHEAILY
jgi:hypothetical protein